MGRLNFAIDPHAAVGKAPAAAKEANQHLDEAPGAKRSPGFGTQGQDYARRAVYSRLGSAHEALVDSDGGLYI